MMRVRALKSFCGAVTMRRGQEMELADPSRLADLLRAGYIEIPHTGETSPDEGQESTKKPKKKGGKGGDAQ